MEELLKAVIVIAQKAGDAIMDIYETDDFGVEMKDDAEYGSPLTKADKAANNIIVAELEQISDHPVVSEENELRKTASERFWLVDPLDGTKEFVKRNGEFTVNIGLIENETPILGVVYAPAKNVLYFGAAGVDAFKQEGRKEPQAIKAEYKGEIPKVVVSRSHRDDKIDTFLKIVGEHDETNMGSSLKLCLVAEGAASLYPRLAPTYLWDTAAADAIVRVAGGSVQDVDGNPLRYNLDVMKNPDFIVKSASNS